MYKEKKMELEIKKEIIGDTLNIKLNGKLDTSTFVSLENELVDISDFKNIIFDFKDLIYISSVGLRILLSVYKKTLANGGKLSVINLNETVKTVFEETGFLDLLGN